MANDNLLFRKGSVSGIKTAAYMPGAISITTDEPGIYVDLCEGDAGYVAGAGVANRVRVGDFIPVASLAELNALAADDKNVFSPRALYYSTSENMLLKYDEVNKNFKWINDYSKVANDLKTLAEGAVATNTSNIATLNSNLSKEIQDRTDAVNDLQEQINTLTGGEGSSLGSLKTALDEEKAAREAADNAHNASIGELESNLTALDTLVGDLPSDTTATNIVGYIDSKVAAEKSRAEGIEAALRTDVNTANSAATQNASDIGDLRTDLNEEIAAREGAINDLTGDLSGLEEKVNKNTTDIGAEVTRATGAEEELGNRITNLSNDLSGQISGLNTTVGENTSNIAANNQAIAAEASRADAEEKRLLGLINTNNQAISSEASRADAEEKRLLGLINTNINNIAANAATAALNTANISTNAENIGKNAENIGKNAQAIANENTRASNAESALSGRIDAEKSRAEGVEGDLRSSIATEVQNRKDAINTLQQTLTEAYAEADNLLRAEINNKMAAADAMTFMGETDGFSSHADAEKPLPDSGNQKGDTYVVTRQFGNYQIGDLLVSSKDQAEDEVLNSDEARKDFWIWVKTGYSDFNDAILDVDTSNNQIQLKSHLGENLGTVTLASQSDNITVSTVAAANGVDHTVNFNFVWGTF